MLFFHEFNMDVRILDAPPLLFFFKVFKLSCLQTIILSRCLHTVQPELSLFPGDNEDSEEHHCQSSEAFSPV